VAAVDLGETLRRIKPEKRTARMRTRPAGARVMASAMPIRRTVLVPDTCAYIHAASGSLPPPAKALLESAIQYHAATALGEIAAGIGNMPPTRQDYAAVREHYSKLMAMIPGGRVLVPSERDWVEAGLLAGAVARCQNFQPRQRKELLNDALIYVCAAKAGLAVLTNDDHFDLLQQAQPQGAVIFY
jgi:predicted nucleic acid-binding protein